MLNISFTQTLPGADLIVATVGRLYDFVRAGIINLEDRFRAPNGGDHRWSWPLVVG